MGCFKYDAHGNISPPPHYALLLLYWECTVAVNYVLAEQYIGVQMNDHTNIGVEHRYGLHADQSDCFPNLV